MAKQFDRVNCQYGAPMGRSSFNDTPVPFGKVRLFKVNLDSGGYDDGGAYWGHGDQYVYCARNEGFMWTCRANSRDDAKAQLLADWPTARLYR